MASKTGATFAIDLLMTAACNMRCRHCHSGFDGQETQPTSVWHAIIAAIDAATAGRCGPRKITFAGGEPLLCGGIGELISDAAGRGFFVSVITNGVLLPSDASRIDLLEVDEIGISVDSLDPATNLRIGRCLGGGSTVDYRRSCAIVRDMCKRLKVNTVVCRANVDQTLTAFMNDVRPQRWKILQVRVIRGANDGARDALVSDAEFAAFATRNRTGLDSSVAVAVEDEAAQLGSYLMVDPSGRLFDAASGAYRRSDPILAEGLEHALGQIVFLEDRFAGRGGQHFAAWVRRSGQGEGGAAGSRQRIPASPGD